MNKVNVVIMAGAPAGESLSPQDPSISRAMIPLGDKTMLQWIVDALRGASSVGRIVAVGDVSADGLDEVIPPGDDLVGNMKLGISAIGACEAVLIVCSDVPLLTSEAVDDFVARAVAMGVDMAYPIIRREDCARRHPELKRTYLKTWDGVFTGGNIMLLRPEFVTRNWQAIEDAYTARKRIGELARMIGIGVLARVILAQAFPGALKVAALERAVSKMLGGKVAAVISSYPEIGEDVDKLSDLVAVRGILCSDNAE